MIIPFETLTIVSSIRTKIYAKPTDFIIMSGIFYVGFSIIIDIEAIFERVRNQCDLFWLENLNLCSGFKKNILNYIAGKYPSLVPLYDEIYNRHDRSYFKALEKAAEDMEKNTNVPLWIMKCPTAECQRDIRLSLIISITKKFAALRIRGNGIKNEPVKSFLRNGLKLLPA